MSYPADGYLKSLETELPDGTTVRVVAPESSPWYMMVGTIGQAAGRMAGWRGISFPHSCGCVEVEEGTKVVSLPDTPEITDAASPAQRDLAFSRRAQKIAEAYRHISKIRTQGKGAGEAAVQQALARIESCRLGESDARRWIDWPLSKIAENIRVAPAPDLAPGD